MDLLGDIGQTDQLTSARTENALLHQKVQELQRQVALLTADKIVLQGELHEVRQQQQQKQQQSGASALGDDDTSAAAISKLTLADNASDNIDNAFLRSSGGSAAAQEEVYCHIPELVFRNEPSSSLASSSSVNPVCVTLSLDSTCILVGGADGSLRLIQWGNAAPPGSTAATTAADDADSDSRTNNSNSRSSDGIHPTVQFAAPVVCVAVTNLSWKMPLIAVGLMDGSVMLATYSHPCSNATSAKGGVSWMVSQSPDSSSAQSTPPLSSCQRHSKYVTAVVWWTTTTSNDATHGGMPVQHLATSSADGTIHIYTIVPLALAEQQQEHPGPLDGTTNEGANQDSTTALSSSVPWTVHHVQSFYMEGAIACMCYSDNVLYAYERETPHLTCIHLPKSISNNGGSAVVAKDDDDDKNEYTVTKLHLNTYPLDDHVSFAILCIRPCPLLLQGKRYLAAATDSGRHLILAAGAADATENRDHAKNLSKASHCIVRNLYGHDADCYSNPVIAWSRNGRYLYSNTQHDCTLLVYDIASGKRVFTSSSNPSPSNTSDLVKDERLVVSNEPKPNCHTRPIKDICSSSDSDLLVSISFDRQIIVWFPSPESFQ